MGSQVLPRGKISAEMCSMEGKGAEKAELTIVALGWIPGIFLHHVHILVVGNG